MKVALDQDDITAAVSQYVLRQSPGVKIIGEIVWDGEPESVTVDVQGAEDAKEE